MHIVTKMLIVGCAILSLLLSALSIAYASNANALRTSLRSERALRTAAEETARNAVQQGAQDAGGASERLKAMENEMSGRTTQIANLQQERTELRSELEKSRSESLSTKNQIGQLGVTTETQAALIKNYRDEVTTLRDSLLTGQKREIELVDRVNELESAREVLQQNARALKEQLEETRLSLQGTAQAPGGSGASGGPGAGGAPSGARPVEGTAREMPGGIVRARIAEVFASPAGDPMVVISEGANRGIKPNTLMHVVRNGDQFVGSVTITAVEPDRAVGRVNTYGKPVAVQQNDMVLSRLTF